MELTIHIEGAQITLCGESLAQKLEAIDGQLRLAEAHCLALRRERKLIGKLDRLLSATRQAKRQPATNGHAPRREIAPLTRHKMSELRAAALEHLRANGPSQVRDVGKAIGLDPARASQTLVSLMAAGRVRQVRRGVYEIDPAAEREGHEEPP
jgi:predicted Rossmann fold nucleotide-binding protein DprA/Smf involved in DNA uptake